jgi:outer membrane protein assembly factor BamB
LLPAEQAWLRDLQDLPAAGGALDRDRVYIPLQSAGTIALDRETGQAAWTNPTIATQPLVLAPGLVIAINAAEIVAVDRATGSTTWQVSVPSTAIGAAIVAGSLLLAPLQDGSIVAVQTRDHSIAWAARFGTLAPPVSLATDAMAVYVTTGDSRVVALTLSSGEQLWQRTLTGMLSPSDVAKDRVFVGSTSNAFFALDSSTGQEAWHWGRERIGGDVIGSATDGDVTYYVGLDNLLHAVNRGNGNQRWKQPTPTRPIAPPIAFGGIVAVFGVSPAVATFDAKTGMPIGTYVIPAVGGASAAPRPPLIDPELQPFRVAMVAITADGRAIGLRPTGMMFREGPTVPLTELPGRPLQRERLPVAPTGR